MTLGTAALLPEHAPRDEAAKIEESQGDIQVSENKPERVNVIFWKY